MSNNDENVDGEPIYPDTVNSASIEDLMLKLSINEEEAEAL